MKKITKNLSTRNAQAIVEYLILFVTVVAIAVLMMLSPGAPFRSAVGDLYNRTADSIRSIPIH